MRIVRTLVEEEKSDQIIEILETENIDYIVSRESSDRGDHLVVEFLVPQEALDVVLDRFDDVGHGDHSYTAVADARTALSENIEEIEERFVVGEEEDSSIATEELRSQSLKQLSNTVTFYVLTFLSAVVATAGLLLDAPALVVGSMVIAPLVGSALTASVGTVLGDRSMILTGFKTQIYGLCLAIIGSIVFGLFLKSGLLVPPSITPSTTSQIAKRISPGLLSLVIGVCAGAAGAISISTDISAALVGVMIAAALIPAAAAVGIGIVWGVPSIALGAAILLIVNAASIHASGVVVFLAQGYRPQGMEDEDRWSNISFEDYRPSLVVAVVLLVLFVVAGAAISTHIAFERSATGAVEETLNEQRYEELELVGVSAGFHPPMFADSRQTVTVTLRRPASDSFPKVSDRIKSNLEPKTEADPIVVVEFVESQWSTTSRGIALRSSDTAGSTTSYSR